jgi:hypothetical protein
MQLNGRVLREGEPVGGAYVRLLGPSGEFTAELRTDDSGHFTFYPVEGAWTLIGMLPGGIQVKCSVILNTGQTAEVDLEVSKLASS